MPYFSAADLARHDEGCQGEVEQYERGDESGERVHRFPSYSSSRIFAGF